MIASLALDARSARRVADAVREPHQPQVGQATIISATVVPEGPAPARGGGWGRTGGAARTRRPAHQRHRDDPRALPRAARAQALLRFADQHGALAAARGQVEREVHGRRQRRLRRIDSGSGERDAAGAAPRLCDRGHRHRPPGAGRRVGDRSSREDDRLRLPRDARDDAEVQADRQGVLRSRARSTPTSRAVRPADAWR